MVIITITNLRDPKLVKTIDVSCWTNESVQKLISIYGQHETFSIEFRRITE